MEYVQMQVTRIQLSPHDIGVGLFLFGVALLWVRFAHERNNGARAIYTVYEKLSVGSSVDTYLLAAGLGLMVFGFLLFSGVIV
jgi:hypothetical protein